MAASAFLLLALVCCLSVVHSQLDFTATTPSAAESGKPNTFIGTTGSQIATSLLASNTRAMLWGSVPSSVITQVCNLIVSTGQQQFTANVQGSWGGSDSLTLQLVATGGCGAAQDSSGTQFVFSDNLQRKSAIVCPNNAGTTGCGVYLTGDDINAIYNGDARTSSGRTRKLLDCQEEAGKGAITGAITGVLGISECLALGPLAPFCAAGVIGVSAELGALGGCVSSCFPGNAKVELVNGETKAMSELVLGDKVAVERNGQKGFEDVYAFGHKDATATSTFVKMRMNSDKTLELSPLHFVPTIVSGGQVVHKRAQDVKKGDTMLVTASNGTLVPCSVADISIVVSHGLFNPFTISGTILVDGVVASVHSDWFLDNVYEALGMTHLLPASYQVVLLPARVLYRILGRDNYSGLYHWLDSRLDIAATGTKFGGLSALAVSTVVVLAALKTFSNRGKL